MKCPECRGTGKILIRVHDVWLHHEVRYREVDCDLCGGTGEIKEAEVKE